MPTSHTSPERLLELIAACRHKRVVVFGDLLADEFVYGRIARVSREAPVLILEYDTTEVVPGGAGNAANNVAALGGDVAAGRAGRPRRARPPAARGAAARASIARASSGRGGFARRRRRASSPAAFTRRSSRWFASIAARSGPVTDARRAAFERAVLRARPRRRRACWCLTTAPDW